jgi:long-chain acyl-CoA synthetase
MNVVDYLMGDKASDRDALLTLSGSHSYGELAEATNAIARFLLNSGARKGDRVLLLGENSFFWVASYLGTLKAGCIAVPLSSGTTGEELRYIIQSCAISVAFVHTRINQDQLSAFSPDSKIVSEDSIAPSNDLKLDTVTFKDLRALPRKSAIGYPAIDEFKDLAAIMFTSGSTGRPRGVMVSHLNIMANTSSIVDCLGLTGEDRVMAVLPFYYCFGTSLLHTHLRAGGSLVLDSRFMFPDKVLIRMQETSCTGFAGVPSHYQMLLRKSSFKKMQFPALRYVQQAGGKLPDTMIRELREAIGASTKVFVMYGQTEATARLSYLPPEMLDTKLGSIGKGMSGVHLTVVDENGGPVSSGQIGEIIAEGDNITSGYWNAKEETSATFRNGRLYTGDLATVDDEGFIFIVDRSKDILKCGGKRISCKEVEDMLLQFEGLVEVAVIGIPDELFGEAVKAFVVPEVKNGHLVERLQVFCSQRFPSHLIPKEIIVLDELPKSSAGKILKPALKLMN